MTTKLIETAAVKIEIGDALLEGDLTVPEKAQGCVLFAHGSGSSRLSPRNAFVAERLNEAGFATLLMDLLTSEEEAEGIEFLACRLVDATDWLKAHPSTSRLPIGYFGASTGAGAALKAAPVRPGVKAIVSRGGRPDLAGSALGFVEAPTLFIVGGNDPEVIRLNRSALQALKAAHKELRVVPGATHLFEEPGALETVARFAADWFKRYLE